MALGWPLVAAAQQNDTNRQEKKVERAVDRCKAQRGVDCETAQGLQEWVLQERSRAEAVLDGSRRRVSTPPRR